MIICPKCEKEKDKPFFSKDSRTKNGFKCWCKECSFISHKKWAIKNKKHFSEYMKSYRKNNSKRTREIQRISYMNNQERVLNYRKSEKGILSSRNSANKRRLIKKNTSDGTITPKFLLSLIKIQNYKCANCFKDIKLKVGIKHENACDMDHIIPLKLGGKHISSNVQFLCKKCNAYKKDKLINLVCMAKRISRRPDY